MTCLSVCDVGVLWPNDWMDQDETWHVEVGLGPDHTVFDGDPAAPPQRGTAPTIFGSCLLWPNGWLDQDATWYGGRPQPMPHCIRWEPHSPSQKGAEPPIFSPRILWPNGWMDQDATWYMEVGLSPGHIVLHGDPAPPPPEGAYPQFSAHVYCGQTVAYLSYC